MAVFVMSDVGGTAVTMHVNGAKQTIDLHTAYQLNHYLAITLDRMAQDALNASVREKLKETYHAS